MPFPLPRPLPMPRPRPPLAPSLRGLREEARLARASPAGACIICLHALGLRHVVLGPSALGFGATRAAAAAAVPARRLLSTAASNQASMASKRRPGVRNVAHADNFALCWHSTR